MKNVLTLCLLFFGLCSQESMAKSEKIISLNGAVTEIVCALGFQENIIATDVTSTYPSSLQVKDLGHVRSLSIEAIIALKPTLILATTKDLNPELMAKLRASGIKTQIFDQEFSIQGTKDLIKNVAGVLGVKEYKNLIDDIDKKLKSIKKPATKPKVLFVYARGAGTLMVAGNNTAVERMITLAGGQNAVTGFSDFKPLTPEALLMSNPDYILFFETGLNSLGGINGALNIEGLAKTKAGKNKNIIAMDGALLSGFGPRVGEGVFQLNQLIINVP